MVKDGIRYLKPGISAASQGPAGKAGDRAPCHARACPHLPAHRCQPVMVRPGMWSSSFICLVCSARAASAMLCLQGQGTVLHVLAQKVYMFPPARGHSGNGRR